MLLFLIFLDEGMSMSLVLVMLRFWWEKLHFVGLCYHFTIKHVQKTSFFTLAIHVVWYTVWQQENCATIRDGMFTCDVQKLIVMVTEPQFCLHRYIHITARCNSYRIWNSKNKKL